MVKLMEKWFNNSIDFNVEKITVCSFLKKYLKNCSNNNEEF
jgi:hypothetical protein